MAVITGYFYPSLTRKEISERLINIDRIELIEHSKTDEKPVEIEKEKDMLTLGVSSFFPSRGYYMIKITVKFKVGWVVIERDGLSEDMKRYIDKYHVRIITHDKEETLSELKNKRKEIEKKLNEVIEDVENELAIIELYRV